MGRIQSLCVLMQILTCFFEIQCHNSLNNVPYNVMHIVGYFIKVYFYNYVQRVLKICIGKLRTFECNLRIIVAVTVK